MSRRERASEVADLAATLGVGGAGDPRNKPTRSIFFTVSVR